MLYIILKLGESEGNALNGVQIGVEMKKLQPSEDNCAELKNYF